MILLELEKEEPQFIKAVRAFLPIVKQLLEIDIPKIHLIGNNGIETSFGQYNPNSKEITVNIENRHIVDILRTLAHELVHYKQDLENNIESDSGNTGSDIENQANSAAGVIMRMFNKKHPEFLSIPAVELKTNLTEKRKKKRKNISRGPIYGWYGWGTGENSDMSADAGGIEESTVFENADVIDNLEGAGATGYNRNATYMGLRVMMTPKQFVDVSPEISMLDQSTREYVLKLAKYIKDGGKIASPFLIVQIPQSWGEDRELENTIDIPKIIGHEGRHRMHAIWTLYGKDFPIECHIFPQYYRAHDFNQQWKEQLQKEVIAEKSTKVVHNWFNGYK